MKLQTVNTIAEILSSIKINKIEDKEVKNVLVEDYLQLRRHIKKAAEDQQEIVSKFQEDWKEEIPIIEELRKEEKPLDEHEDYLAAEKDANKAISDLFKVDVDVDLKSVTLEAFLEGVDKDELTIEQVAFLEDCGVIK